MHEKYLYIGNEEARSLLRQIGNMEPARSGVNSQVYLTDGRAVLYSENLKVRNVTVRDDGLVYLEELAVTLMQLNRQGTGVVPILGFCCDESGRGYIFQPRARGEELYDDKIMEKYCVYGRELSGDTYPARDRAEQEYILSRTHFVSQIPQRHFDKFMEDIITLLDRDVLIDFMGKSNFFYDETAGFQFIDINSHTDYKYGLTGERPDSRLICAYNGFVPCHTGAGSGVMPRLALDEGSFDALDSGEILKLKNDNRVIFEKCRAAMISNGVTSGQLDSAMELLKLFGV